MRPESHITRAAAYRMGKERRPKRACPAPIGGKQVSIRRNADDEGIEWG
jgi:hypothetical protein